MEEGKNRLKPKAFISYSWSSPDHEKKVLDLATELRERNGIDIILDKWDLKEGQDAVKFMEKMVSDDEIKKVLMICDKTYCAKTNNREGGVGTEAQIISSKIYENTDQNKFVAIIFEKDENNEPYIPIYYRGRIHIDLSSDINYFDNFERLKRWLWDEPLYKKPEIGDPPKFLDDEKIISLKTEKIKNKLFDLIKNNAPNRNGYLKEYLNTFSQNLELFRIKNSRESVIDDLIIENIELFLPYRNEFIDLINLLSIYGIDENIINIIFHFFESLIKYFHKPENTLSNNDEDFDNFKFIIHEIFLYLIAILIKYEKFNLVSYLMSNRYYFSKRGSDNENSMLHFTIFMNHLKSFKFRNDRLKLQRLSLHADLLKERISILNIDFNYLMQADFVLYVRSLFDIKNSDCYKSWHPITMVHMLGWQFVFEIFSRSESLKYFKTIKVLFGIENKEEFSKLFQFLKENDLHRPSWQSLKFDEKFILNYENLCIRK